MSVAVEPNSNSPEPLDTIEKAIQDKFKENFKPSEKYKLTFTFEGTDNKTKEYSTIFKFNSGRCGYSVCLFFIKSAPNSLV